MMELSAPPALETYLSCTNERSAKERYLHLHPMSVVRISSNGGDEAAADEAEEEETPS